MNERDLAKKIDNEGRFFLIRHRYPDGGVYFGFGIDFLDGRLDCLEALAALRRTMPYLRRRQDDARIIVDEFADLWADRERGAQDSDPSWQLARYDRAMQIREDIMKRNP
jgi:hypothetical protein